MSTTTLDKKDSRLDLRMTSEQKSLIERAAALSGMSVSQWSMNALVKCARSDIMEWNAVKLCEEDFEALLRVLDEPANAQFQAFASDKTRWEE